MHSPSTHFSDTLRRLDRRVRRFVANRAEDSAADTFDDLAREVVVLQSQENQSYARLLEARQLRSTELDGWELAPPVPTSAFQHQRFCLAEPELVFRSSGTTQGPQQRSAHHHANLSLYRLIVRNSFPQAVLHSSEIRGEEGDTPIRQPMLSLIAPRSVVPYSSLGFMTDYVMQEFGTPESRYAFSGSALDLDLAADWLATTSKQQPILLTTALALWSLLDHLDSNHGGTPPRWSESLIIMETGGFKTRRFDITREQLIERLAELVGVTESQVVREYGMTELTSQAYAGVRLSPESEPRSERFALPHWVRARALDPVTMRDVAPGETGLLSFLDLGNIASMASIVTEDLGSVEPGGRHFRLLGRAADAQLRGCSLTTEALLGDTP